MSERPSPADAPAAGDATERLLAREPEAAYLESWTRSLARPLFDPHVRGDLPGLLALLGTERYLLPAAIVREVHPTRPVHRIPGRTNAVLRGLVCLRGELVLAADLHAALGAGPRPAASRAARMLVLERLEQRFAVEVDAVLDVRRYERSALAPAPVTVARAAAHVAEATLATRQGRAALLDPERLFAALARSLS